MLAARFVLLSAVTATLNSAGEPSSLTTPANTITLYSRAKRLMIDTIDIDRRTKFYCDCRFDAKKIVDHGSCGYIPRRPSNARVGRTEVEHIVSAHAFGQIFVEWREGHHDWDPPARPIRYAAATEEPQCD